MKWLLLAIFVISACGHSTGKKTTTAKATTKTAPKATRRLNPARQVVLQTVKRYAKGEPLVAKGFTLKADPIGFVRAAFWQANMELLNERLALQEKLGGMELMYRSLALQKSLHYETPVAGDIVFLDADLQKETYPKQLGIVEHVDTNGTLIIAGFFENKVARVRMNLREPTRIKSDDGTVLNDTLGGTEQTPLAQLFRAFANPF